MLGKTSWYSIDVSANDRHNLLFYKKWHFCHLHPFAKVGQYCDRKFQWNNSKYRNILRERNGYMVFVGNMEKCTANFNTLPCRHLKSILMALSVSEGLMYILCTCKSRKTSRHFEIWPPKSCRVHFSLDDRPYSNCSSSTCRVSTDGAAKTLASTTTTTTGEVTRCDLQTSAAYSGVNTITSIIPMFRSYIKPFHCCINKY